MAPTSTHRTRALSRNTASAPERYELVRADGLWWYAPFAALRPRIRLEYPQTAHDGPAVVRCVWSRSIPVAARSGLHAPGGPCPLVGYRPRGEPSMLRPSRGRHRTYTPQQLSGGVLFVLLHIHPKRLHVVLPSMRHASWAAPLPPIGSRLCSELDADFVELPF